MSSLKPGLRTQNSRGMRFERHRDGLAAAGSSAGNNLPQDVRVRLMYAVKISDADERRAEVGGNIVEFVKNLHESISRRS